VRTLPKRFVFHRTLFALVWSGLLVSGHAAGKEDERPVEPAKLAALIKQADKIVAFDSPGFSREGIFYGNPNIQI
jgi:hypothetical protein